MRQRHIGLLLLGMSVLLLGLGRAARGEGFESGFGPGDSTTGDAGIRTSYFGINPIEGSSQLLLTTINSTSGSAADQAGYTNQSGNNSVSATTLASFFGISAAQIQDGGITGKQGSGFSITLGVLSAGQTLSFDYDFLTQEANDGSGNKDFAFFTLTNQNGTTVIADVLNATFNTPTSPAGNPFGSQTQYLTRSISIPSSGSYTLGIGVADAGNPSTDDAPSALLVDNIRTSAIPEPSTIALGVIGVLSLGALRKRPRKP